MEWLIILLLPLPFVAMYKMASWLDRIESIGKLQVLPDPVRRCLRPILGLLWWMILLLGTPYFIYADAKMVSRLSRYNECPCDAGLPRKQFFCLYSWDFLAEITDHPRRLFTKRELEIIADVRRQIEFGELTAQKSIEDLKLAAEKQEADARDLHDPSAYPPIVPQCENAP